MFGIEYDCRLPYDNVSFMLRQLMMLEIKSKSLTSESTVENANGRQNVIALYPISGSPEFLHVL